MAFSRKSILGKIGTFKKFTRLRRDLEKSLAQLESNTFYGQQLASIGSWIHDLEKDEIFRTEEFYRILGRNPQNLDNRIEDYLLCVHPDDVEYVKKAIQGVFEGRDYDIEHRIITPDGVEKYVHDKAKVFFDEANKPIRIVGILQDITHKKLIERDLQELGDHLNQAQRVAEVGSWKYNVSKDAFYGSEEMYRICGVAPQDVKNDFQNTLKLVHPENKVKVQNTMEKLLRGEACEVEFRILQADGNVKYVISRGEPSFDQEGKIVSILGTMQDITNNKLLELELKKSHRIIAQTEALAHMGSWEMDLATGKCDWSEEVYRIFGITPEQYDNTYKGIQKNIHPDDRKIIENMLKNPSKEPCELEYRIIKPDGTVRHLYALAEFVFDQDGKPRYLYGTLQDITEKKEMQKAIEDKQKEIDKMQRVFQILVQESSDVFEIIDPDGTIKYISEASERVIGYKAEERTGKRIYDYYSEEQKQKLKKMVDRVLHGPDIEVEGVVVLKAKSGKSIFLEVHMQNLLHEPDIEGIVINFRDVSKRIEMEKHMEYLATHDELTGLPNTVFLKNEINKQCQLAKEKHITFAVMMLDVDRFKHINDALDYGSGDELIIQIADRLRNHLKDHIVCRYLGDQFAIVLPGLGEKAYSAMAKEILDLFLDPFRVGQYELYITSSMGISIYPEDGEDYASLIKHASIALRRAKDETKNKYVFYSTNMDIHNYKRFILQHDLHKAIEKNEIRVYFQPEVDLRTNEIVAVEALIRWEHPTWGLVSPGEFISIAEESGFIINLGSWMLRKVCQVYKGWLDDGLPAIKVSINYSSIQFFESNFIEKIKTTIAEFGLKPDFLVIEITESVLAKNPDMVISHIKDLQALGIQVAIDDFGTGVSSLGYLSMFNIDILKIYRSFIKDINSKGRSSIITRHVINMARELRIKLVAEGVEDWNQLTYLLSLNCHIGQGYLYSKPVDEHAFKKMLAKKECKPLLGKNIILQPSEDRRQFYRIHLKQLLEADMTIMEIGGKKIQIGNSKVLIKDIGPGGLCFVSNLRLPIKRDLVLLFVTELLGEEIRTFGCPVWIEEVQDQIYEYGIEFTFDENARSDLIGILNQVQVKLKQNAKLVDSRLVTTSPIDYFKSYLA
ncbi:MAG: EAL domain-containing protein [Clostridia bacterium]|jgi:diguanylate cyclase (GGDEF)-like protein/PAS domain S-box-containing protein